VATFLLNRFATTAMKPLLTLSGLLLLFCASVVIDAGALIRPTQTHVSIYEWSEPGGLLMFGFGFVLLAGQVRRKKST
jgi:hypothetical protein